jgi:signal transduction histidine kinase
VVGRQREHLGADHTLVLTRDPGGQYAEVDSDRLEQVITNLIDNAVKYSPGGGEVRATVRREGHEVTIEVVDQGIGLPPGAAESIFEPFGRASNATVRHLPGMGLGLYICRNIVELHGGSIRAESPGEEQGTTMRVCLPDAPEDPAAEQRTASEC